MEGTAATNYVQAYVLHNKRNVPSQDLPDMAEANKKLEASSWHQ